MTTTKSDRLPIDITGLREQIANFRETELRPMLANPSLSDAGRWLIIEGLKAVGTLPQQPPRSAA